MPEYTYECDGEKGGCGNIFSVLQKISKYKPLKKCPECRKHKLRRLFEVDNVSTSVRCSDSEITLGHLAERNSSRMSNDERSSLKKNHNSYKDAGKGDDIEIIYPKAKTIEVTGQVAERYDQLYTVRGMSIEECRKKTFNLFKTLEEISDG